MPSGSYVVVRPYRPFLNYRRRVRHLNIWVYPMRVDAYHTTGLCGNYNLNSGDDRPSTSGLSCTADCEAHRHEPVLTVCSEKCRASN